MSKIHIAIAIILLVGCSLFTPTVPSVVEQMLAKAAERVAEEAGKKLADVPMQCDFEIDQNSKKLLMLCEADLR
jgi:hypothetical protein